MTAPSFSPDDFLATFRVGAFAADRAGGTLTGPDGQQRLEPKVMDLLAFLAARDGRAVAREEIIAALWPGLVVGEDSLARTVSKLRRALGDDAKAPRYIETIAKRGYRLLADVQAPVSIGAVGQGLARAGGTQRVSSRWRWSALALAAMVGIGLAWVVVSGARPLASDAGAQLVGRADDYYFQFSRGDNEAAIELYQRVLGLRPDDPLAMAGLANALVQRSVRWPDGEPSRSFDRLGVALASGHLEREPARSQVRRAALLAQRAVELAPESAATHKAFGFVASAQGRFDAAFAAYRTAVALDPDAWGPMINIGDLYEITGKGDQALSWFEQAHAAMMRVYERTPVQVRPWHAQLGVLIGDRRRARGEMALAEGWYRRVLAQSPLHPGATAGLAQLLRAAGDAAQAEHLCTELAERTGARDACIAR